MRALYDEEVAYLDAQIGRLREGLVAAGLDRDAIWVLTADHGESHGEHDRYFGRGLHAPSLRVPLSLRFPDGAYGGRRVSPPVRLVDVEPTLAEWLGLPQPTGSGRSLLARVRGESDAPRPVYSLLVGANPDRSYALQDDRYKLIQHSTAWRDHGYRIEPPREELFDVEADPGETRDLGAGHPAAAALRQRLSAWRERDPERDPSQHPLDPEVVRRLRSLGYMR
jgi:arylsulfatase A-like enzyme